ncbi:MAG: hypothetical protein RBS78_03930 [Coriobacteriia bacterium]|nr:hypothetical protein [Coriobacteriia bacterium]
MRKAIAAIIAAMLALTLVACGGGAQDKEAEQTPEAGAEAEAPPAESESVAEPWPEDEQVYEAFPVAPEVGVPTEIQSRLDAGRPMIVVFYDESQKTTDDQEEVIRTVTDMYRGLVDVVSFNIGTYITRDSKGEISVRPDIDADEAAKKVAALISAEGLDIRLTPFTAVVDGQGYVTWRHRGIGDAKILEREVLRVTQ